MTDEAMCIDYFLKNRSKFTYKDEDGDDVDMLAIEEIGHYNLSFGTLKRIVEEADGMRETFGDDTEIKLLNLLYTQGLSYKEISEITNENIETLKKRRTRALKKLKKVMEE